MSGVRAGQRSPGVRWSTTLVSQWVRYYTLGLPEDARRERRDEIASDLWEHAHDETRTTPLGPEILTRGMLGVPADLAWRLERSRLARLPSGLVAAILGTLARLETVGRWIARRGLPGFTSATSVVTGLIGVLVIVTAPTNDSGAATAGLIWWGSLLIVGALSIGLGGRLIADRTRLGGVLVILGSGMLGLLLWPTVIAPIVALALGGRAAIRIRDDRRQRHAEVDIDL